ncbi:FCD domain-containing protein [Streptomyces sp. NPDC002619]|uniref:FCD domain-containing protein n=1 Tax=Streptomyces sp. NPDC002619 TaxID=3364655 RepID=UPI00369C9BCA
MRRKLSPESVRSADDPTLAEHERVVRAILRRKADRAAEVMAEHLTRGRQRQLGQAPPRADRGAAVRNLRPNPRIPTQSRDVLHAACLLFNYPVAD